MPEPLFVFAFILSTLLGAGFHFIFGGDVRRLAVFLLTGWFSFAFGHFAGAVLGLELISVGTLRTGSALLTAIVALTVMGILTGAQARRRSPR